MSFTIYHMAYAALMHDIGKFRQRTGAKDLDNPRYTSKCRFDNTKKYLTYKHVMWTTEFLYNYPLPIEDWDSIAEIAGCHHNPSVFQHTNYERYLIFLGWADQIASNWDREEAEDYTGKYRADKVPLFSIFDTISIEAQKQVKDRQHCYGINVLSPDNTIPETYVERNLKADYEGLWNQFVEEFTQLHKKYVQICTNHQKSFIDKYFPQYINAVEHLLRKYTWSIPSNTTETNPANSLYHHSTNVAAISTALYAAEALSLDVSLEQVSSGKEPFIIIACDLNGIQNYLYDLNPENSKNASKLLRSRSAQIRIILEVLSRWVLDDLGLTKQNIFFNASGKWMILAPNHPEIIEKMSKLKTEIEADIYSRFLGELSINLNWDAQIGLYDLKKEHFLTTIHDCIQGLESYKMRKFDSILYKGDKWDTAAFIISHAPMYSDTQCRFCLRRPSEQKGKDRICPQCEAEIELGAMLAKNSTSVYKIFRDEKAHALIKIGAYGFTKADESELSDPYPDTEYFFIKHLFDANHILPVLPIASSVPIKDNGEMMDFDEIAQNSNGEKALAVMKGDVNNLSMLFRLGLRRLSASGKEVCSITDYTTFSYMLDYFFSVYVPYLIYAKFGKSIYTVYSGGDDFCIIGAWDKIIAFTDLLFSEFRKYTGANAEIHFAAAICMLHSNAPVKFVIKETDDFLKLIKGLDCKNQLYLFETIIPFDKLQNQMEFAQTVHEWLNDDKDAAKKGVTKQFIYRLLGYHEMYERSLEAEEVTHNNLYDALLVNDIRRNIVNRAPNNNEVVDLFTALSPLTGESGIQYLRLPICYVLYQNRENKED